MEVIDRSSSMEDTITQSFTQRTERPALLVAHSRRISD